MRRHGNEGALAWAGGPRNLRLPRARGRTWGNPSRERGSDRAFAGLQWQVRGERSEALPWGPGLGEAHRPLKSGALGRRRAKAAGSGGAAAARSRSGEPGPPRGQRSDEAEAQRWARKLLLKGSRPGFPKGVGSHEPLHGGAELSQRAPREAWTLGSPWRRCRWAWGPGGPNVFSLRGRTRPQPTPGHCKLGQDST